MLPDERGRRNAGGIRRSRERKIERGREAVKWWSRGGRQVMSDEKVCGWTRLDKWLSATSATGYTS